MVEKLQTVFIQIMPDYAEHHFHCRHLYFKYSGVLINNKDMSVLRHH